MESEQDVQGKEGEEHAVPSSAETVKPREMSPEISPEVKNEEKKEEVLPPQLSEEEARVAIQQGFEGMRVALARVPHPDFKKFWEVRTATVPLLKLITDSKERSLFWDEVARLSLEAKRSKEHLEQASAFAVEQIRLAVDAIDKDLQRFDELVALIPEAAELKQCQFLKEHAEFYLKAQRELKLLTGLASKLQGLRKEVLATEMRMRDKVKFLERLSKLGDLLFPRRKELLKNVSERFLTDIGAFAEKFFPAGQMAQSAHLGAVREGIQQLQQVAKMLALAPQAFGESRTLLSGCWEQLKKREKERKEQANAEKKREAQAGGKRQEAEGGEKRESGERRKRGPGSGPDGRRPERKSKDPVAPLVLSDKGQLVAGKVRAFAEKCAAGAFLAEAAMEASEALLDEMREMRLPREEEKRLRGDLLDARKPLQDQLQQKQQALVAAREEQDRRIAEKGAELKRQLQQLMDEADKLAITELQERRDQIADQIPSLSLSKLERQRAEQQLARIRERIADRKEEELLAADPALAQSMQHLEQMWEERQARRLQSKQQLESYRKAMGGSGLDFEKAMIYQDLCDAERARLDKLTEEIEEIEEKIAVLLPEQD